MGVDADKKELAELISQIDHSITNGMTQTQVLGLLGQPTMWSTNGIMIDADFEYVRPGRIPYGSITSGFTITFSNGTVLQKSPVISSFQ